MSEQIDGLNKGRNNFYPHLQEKKVATFQGGGINPVNHILDERIKLDQKKEQLRLDRNPVSVVVETQKNITAYQQKQAIVIRLLADGHISQNEAYVLLGMESPFKLNLSEPPMEQTYAERCPCHPSNGGSGICGCTLGGPNITY